MGREGQAVFEDGGFDLFVDAIGVRPSRSGELIDQPLGSEGLIVAADLVELLS